MVAEIINNLTETEYDFLCNSYIGHKTHNAPPSYTKTVSPLYIQDSKLKLPIKYFTTTTGNKLNCITHRRKFASTLTHYGHHHGIDKYLRVNEDIGDCIKYSA